MSTRGAKKPSTMPRLRRLAGRPALIGVLVAAIAIPLLSAASVSATKSIDAFDALPTDYQLGSQPQLNRIYAIEDVDSKGKPTYQQVATVYSQNRQEITWAQVTPALKGAVLAAEDARFYDHGGIDIQGIARALISDVITHSSQGGSTLTQQVVKNLCIAQAFKDYPDQANDPAEYKKYQAAAWACSAVSPNRKLTEMKYAIALEKNYSKDEILLAYLNVANYGGTIYGIQAAAKRYYNTTAARLTVEQAASLIATVQTPDALRLDKPANYPANTQRRDYILNRMAQFGYISAADRDAALALKEGGGEDGLKITTPLNGCVAANDLAKQFCDYVVKSVPDLESLGANADERNQNWRIGGYRVYTTLDLRLQKVAQDTVRQYAPADATELELGSVADIVQPGTGRILAMAQNKAFDDTGTGDASTTAVNYSTDQAYGGSSGFQVGSSYKVFTLINWLEHDNGLQQFVNGSARTFQQSDFKDTCYPKFGDNPWGGSYQLNNNEGGHGYMTVRQATAQSVNAAFATMATQLDACDTKKIALAFGMHLAGPVTTTADGVFGPAGTVRGPDDLSTNPSAILGIDAIAPLTVAAAYAGVANNGEYCSPIAVDHIVTSQNETLPGQKTDCSQAMPQDVAVAVQSALQSAEAGYPSNPNDGTPHIAKTGTTNGAIQTWVTTASTNAALTVWFGNIQGDYNIRNYAGYTGGNIRHTIAKAILPTMDELYPGKEFGEPDKKFLTGKLVTVGDYTGLKPSEARPRIAADGLTFDSDFGTIASDLPKGVIARQSYGAGSYVSVGALVKLWVSDGSESAVPDVTTQGLSFDAAAARLSAAGFSRVGQYCVATGTSGGTDPGTGTDPDATAPPEPPADTTPDGIVVSSNPKPGTIRQRTSRIALGVTAQSC